MWKYQGKSRPEFAIAPGPNEESVWDYPRPPALVPASRHVTVHAAGVPIASSTRALRLCETASPPTWYLPMADTEMPRLVEAAGSSFCEWKGAARYWALVERPDTAVAWDYPAPVGAYAALVGHLAFYPARVECAVDGVPVLPQPGAFYGGWITPEVVGPFKGEPGTGHW